MRQSIRLRFSRDMPPYPHLRRIEELAAADRESLGCRFGEPCNPRDLIQLYDVRKILETPGDYEACFNRDVAHEFQGLCWGGAVLCLDDGDHLILANPLDAPVRRTLSIAHEFGHLALGHRAVHVATWNVHTNARNSDDEEMEAFCYALAILLPYAPLLQLRHRYGLSIGNLAELYKVSSAAVKMRLNLTGLG